jgi:nitrogen fixation protein FixH
MNEARYRIPPHIFWPGMVVGLLCVSLTAAAITVVAAVSDPSFAVEEDYYEKALRWDEHVAQQARNAALGWSVEIAPGQRDAAGRTSLRVSLRDRAGAPIEGATITATCFHHAHRADAEQLELVPSGPGEYGAPARLDRPGKWGVSLVVLSGGETFTSDQTLVLVVGGGGSS